MTWFFIETLYVEFDQTMNTDVHVNIHFAVQSSDVIVLICMRSCEHELLVVLKITKWRK